MEATTSALATDFGLESFYKTQTKKLERSEQVFAEHEKQTLTQSLRMHRKQEMTLITDASSAITKNESHEELAASLHRTIILDDEPFDPIDDVLSSDPEEEELILSVIAAQESHTLAAVRSEAGDGPPPASLEHRAARAEMAATRSKMRAKAAADLKATKALRSIRPRASLPAPTPTVRLTLTLEGGSSELVVQASELVVQGDQKVEEAVRDFLGSHGLPASLQAPLERRVVSMRRESKSPKPRTPRHDALSRPKASPRPQTSPRASAPRASPRADPAVFDRLHQRAGNAMTRKRDRIVAARRKELATTPFTPRLVSSHVRDKGSAKRTHDPVPPVFDRLYSQPQHPEPPLPADCTFRPVMSGVRPDRDPSSGDIYSHLYARAVEQNTMLTEKRKRRAKDLKKSEMEGFVGKPVITERAKAITFDEPDIVARMTLLAAAQRDRLQAKVREQRAAQEQELLFHPQLVSRQSRGRDAPRRGSVFEELHRVGHLSHVRRDHVSKEYMDPEATFRPAISQGPPRSPKVRVDPPISPKAAKSAKAAKPAKAPKSPKRHATGNTQGGSNLARLHHSRLEAERVQALRSEVSETRTLLLANMRHTSSRSREIASKRRDDLFRSLFTALSGPGAEELDPQTIDFCKINDDELVEDLHLAMKDCGPATLRYPQFVSKLEDVLAANPRPRGWVSAKKIVL
eukprot:gnl/Dysnectes_brevis/5152_a7282_269.p1 GENE.gnl/Dysnectes_brevis/5152_a7282_269~~gnl/Dysnectes_brevis/5152_a7282_269.p1  ORF type:complete len:690 (-),score=220.54 gnl/Dysnectes_brevis/5152_a7282_269:36-2105(-)